MGSKVNIFCNEVCTTIYLTTASVEWYQRNNIQIEILQDGIDDDIINIFGMSEAITLKEGAAYQELLNYYLSIGMVRDAAVKLAQSQIGINKETLIQTLDVLQADIIAEKAAKIAAAEDLIQQQTDTQKTTFEEIDLSGFGDSAPKINTETNTTENLRNLPSTEGDISKEALDFITSDSGKTPTDKSVETRKEEIEKEINDTNNYIVVKDKDNPTDFKSFGVPLGLALTLGIGVVAIGLAVYWSKKK